MDLRNVRADAPRSLRRRRRRRGSSEEDFVHALPAPTVTAPTRVALNCHRTPSPPGSIYDSVVRERQQDDEEPVVFLAGLEKLVAWLVGLDRPEAEHRAHSPNHPTSAVAPLVTLAGAPREAAPEPQAFRQRRNPPADGPFQAAAAGASAFRELRLIVTVRSGLHSNGTAPCRVHLPAHCRPPADSTHRNCWRWGGRPRQRHRD
eukprot:scaffold3366_cov365-Prasinococcus_capsulatus_cf.AAC.8